MWFHDVCVLVCVWKIYKILPQKLVYQRKCGLFVITLLFSYMNPHHSVMVEGSCSPAHPPPSPILEHTIMQYFNQSSLTNARDLWDKITSPLSSPPPSSIDELRCIGKGLMCLVILGKMRILGLSMACWLFCPRLVLVVTYSAGTWAEVCYRGWTLHNMGEAPHLHLYQCSPV